MLTSEHSHAGRGSKTQRSTRQRPAISCTECRRRKQKCNQAKDRPCNNCLRRFPPVECVYENLKKPPVYTETVINFEEPSQTPKLNASKNDSTRRDISNPSTSRPRQASDSFFILNHSICSLHTERRLTPEANAVALDSLWGTRTLSPATHSRRESAPASSNVQLIHAPRSPGIPRASSFAQQSRADAERRERCKEAYWGILDSCVVNGPVEHLYSLPIRASRRNAELFHLFTISLAPYISSLDGKNPPPRFHDNWVPFIVQSPLTAYSGILSAAYFIAASNRIEADKCPDVIENRLAMVKAINGHLKSKKAINDEALLAVIAFSYNEWIYNSEDVIWHHMQGLREMLKLRGGIRKVAPANVMEMLTDYDIFRADYQIACAFECPLFFHEDNPDDIIPILQSYPLHLDTPLLQSDRKFVDSAEQLGICQEAAKILDDMRFLTTSVLNLTNESHQETTKFFTTVRWIHENLITTTPTADAEVSNTTPPPPDFMLLSIRAAAKIYTTTLLHRLPFSKACTQPMLSELWMNMWQVPLTTWKRLPGCFLGIVFSVLPFARDKAEGRFIKAMTAVATMTVGLQNWQVVVVALRSFRAVQNWLAGLRGVGGVSGASGGGEEAGFSGADVVELVVGDESEGVSHGLVDDPDMASASLGRDETTSWVSSDVVGVSGDSEDDSGDDSSAEIVNETRERSLEVRSVVVAVEGD